MVVEQIIKTLNSTELYLKGTKEYYAQCRQLECLKEWHEDADDSHKIIFKDKATQTTEKFNIYYKGQIRGEDSKPNKENRITSRKYFFVTLKKLNPGDQILFERITSIGTDQKETDTSYFVDTSKSESIIMFQNAKLGLEVLNEKRLNNFLKDKSSEFQIKYNGEYFNCEIALLESTIYELILTKDESKLIINTLNSDHLLKFDFNKMQLSEIDPLMYTRLEY
jgi:hypothetical protein